VPPTKLVLKSQGNLSGNTLTVDFIDVGQGNAVLVTYPNGATMLVDCGSQETSKTGAPYKHVSKYISSVVGDTGTIHCVVMSHGDDDHTWFIPLIPQAAQPSFVHYGGTIGNYADHVQTYIKGLEQNSKQTGCQVFRYPAKGYSTVEPDADFASETTAGEAHVSVLSANFGKSPNSRSIVLLIRYGDHAVILPGDAEADTEDSIISKVPKKMLTGATVLMPGHHGAFESTSTSWVKALKPGISAISASGTNRGYAHPNCATNELLLTTAAPNAADHTITCSSGKGKSYKNDDTTKAVLVTATNGDVRFISDGKNFRLLASTLTVGLALPQPHPILDALVSNAPWSQPAALAPARVRVQELEVETVGV
jgi:beta-lactamase superfamily II metal-dependent hydrolase